MSKLLENAVELTNLKDLNKRKYKGAQLCWVGDQWDPYPYFRAEVQTVKTGQKNYCFVKLSWIAAFNPLLNRWVILPPSYEHPVGSELGKVHFYFDSDNKAFKVHATFWKKALYVILPEQGELVRREDCLECNESVHTSVSFK